MNKAAACLFLLLITPLYAQGTGPNGGGAGQGGSGDWPSWDAIEEALGGGHFWLKTRYRYELVDQDGFSRDAHASTLRTVLGYETAIYEGFSALLEFEDVSPVGNDLYDSTVNGETNRPRVLDPDTTEVNQVFLEYGQEEGGTSWSSRLGRQRITLDNQRFVGNVGWRQNEQTFDALTGQLEVCDFDVFYGYLHNVNRIFGDQSPMGDQRMASHLLNVAHVVPTLGKLTAYLYFLDYETADAFSTITLGARLKGQASVQERFDVLWTAEAAQQDNAGGNPNNVDATYLRFELGGQLDDVRLSVGHELLEGSGDTGDKFQTPLATLHGMNGWADQFLATPDTGLEDTFAALAAEVGGAKLQAVYHDFRADSGGMDYGSEIDLSVTYPVRKNVTVGVKYANYMADEFASDVQKAWVWIGFSI